MAKGSISSVLLFLCSVTLVNAQNQEVHQNTPCQLLVGDNLRHWEQLSPFRGEPVDSDIWTLRENRAKCKRGLLNLRYRHRPMPREFELEFEWKCTGQTANEDANSWKNTSSGRFNFAYMPHVHTVQDRGHMRQRHLSGQIQFEYQMGSGFIRIASDFVARDSNPATEQSWNVSVAPSLDSSRLNGKWNSGRIVWKDDQIEHWVNDRKVVSVSPRRLAQSRGQEGAFYYQLCSELRESGLFLMLGDNEPRKGAMQFRGIKLLSQLYAPNKPER